MKKVLAFISIVVVLLLLPMGCPAIDIPVLIQTTIEEMLAGLRAHYTIEVGGTEGLIFTGRYVVVTAAYDPVHYVALNSTSHDVLGNVPATYTVTDAVSVGAMFQKLGIEGSLEVRLWRGPAGTGTLVDSHNTIAPFGAVLVSGVRER